MTDGGGSSRQPRVRTDGPMPGWAVATITLLTVAWLLGTPFLAIGSLADLWTFSGEQPTPADHDRAQRHALMTTVVATGCPAAAAVLAARRRRGVVQAVFGVGAVLGLVGGLLVHAAVSPEVPDPPARDDGPRVCQEHSGGDSTCPGG